MAYFTSAGPNSADTSFHSAACFDLLCFLLCGNFDEILLWVLMQQVRSDQNESLYIWYKCNLDIVARKTRWCLQFIHSFIFCTHFMWLSLPWTTPAEPFWGLSILPTPDLTWCCCRHDRVIRRVVASLNDNTHQLFIFASLENSQTDLGGSSCLFSWHFRTKHVYQ